MKQRKIIYGMRIPWFVSIEFILVLTAIFLFLLCALIYTKRREFIYPPLHRFQSTPQGYITKKSSTLPSNMIPPVVVTHGDRTKRMIALTFDADMTPAMRQMLDRGLVKSWYNQAIKTTLDAYHVKATVFLGGLWTKTYPDEARTLAHDPLIEIGNHSYNHYAFANSCYGLPSIPDSEDIDDVQEAQNIITKTTGVTPKYFRFPGGCYDSVDVVTLAKLGLTVVHWDVVAGDGFNENAQSIINAVDSQTINGSIIVMHIHDGPYAPKTNDALIEIIPYLQAQGYQFVTISELLNY